MRLLSKLVENRNLLKNLIWRDLKNRYVGSMGGFLWSVVQPLVMLATYTFAFTVVFNQRPGPDSAGVSIPIFLFCGILPWFFFTDTVVRNCSVITENAALVTKTMMPAEILPISITLSSLIHHLVGLAVLVAALVVFHTVSASAFGILIYLPILLLFAQGLGWMAAGLQVFLRDTAQVIQIALPAWYWLTPIMYGLERLDNFQSMALLNPMAVVVTGYRNSLLGLAQPNALQVALAAAISVTVFIAGGLMFRQTRPAFADVL
jgi:ABC-type polysaccharide/polyol phosphate export permease